MNRKETKVSSVYCLSEAAASGLRKGDVIVKYKGIEINQGLEQLQSLVSDTNISDTVELEFVRTITVKGGDLGILCEQGDLRKPSSNKQNITPVDIQNLGVIARIILWKGRMSTLVKSKYKEAISL